MSAKVLLTGCCGYIGAWTTRLLLEAGYRVRGTSVEPGYARSLHADIDAAAGSTLADRLEIVSADLLDQAAWSGLGDGCSAVVHTACPVATEPGTPRGQMYDPAVVGTRNVVREALRAGVPRFVHLSSTTTLFDHHRRVVVAGDEKVGPTSWNETASPELDPYAHAKVEAERSASEEFGAVAGNVFVSVVSGPVLGPPAGGLRVPASVDKQMTPLLSGQLRAGAPALWLGVVDVRDVAAALVAAVARGGGGRYLCVAEPSPSLLDLAHAVRDAHPEYARVLPRGELPLPRWLLLAAMRLTVTREAYSYTRAMLGRRVIYDTTATRTELGWTSRPVPETVAETVTWLKAKAASQPANPGASP